MGTMVDTPYGPQECGCSEADIAKNTCPHAWTQAKPKGPRASFRGQWQDYAGERGDEARSRGGNARWGE